MTAECTTDAMAACSSYNGTEWEVLKYNAATQVRWDDQSQYHQSKAQRVSSLAVDSAVLPPPAQTKETEKQIQRSPVTPRVSHTHVHSVHVHVHVHKHTHAHSHTQTHAHTHTHTHA